jgi:uncharacterized protein (DUF885 family)
MGSQPSKLLKSSLTLIGAAIMAIMLSACSDPSSPERKAADSPQTTGIATETTNLEVLNDLYNQTAATLFKARPLAATSAGAPTNLVGEGINAQMDDYSPQAEAKLRADLVLLNKQIAAFPSASLTPAELENKKVMENVIRYFSGAPAFDIGYVDIWMGLSPFIVNQINGPIIDGPRALSDAHQINSEQDALNYVQRLSSLDGMIANVQAKFVADAQSNWLPPKVILEGALVYIERFIAAQPEQHNLLSVFKHKLSKLSDIDSEQQSALVAQATEALTNQVYPAYRNLAAKIKEWLPKAQQESGIWAQPKGADYYKDAIKQLGDSDLTADQIHQIGLDEVQRITTQMDKILLQQGYKKGSVSERMVSLSKEKRFLYDDSEAGRAALIDDVNGYISAMTEAMAPLFKTKPQYQVEVRSFPKETQDSMPGGQYTPPPLDGSIPGIYWINLRDMEAVATFTLKTLTYHEANPGHHWQISLALEQQDAPFLRLIAPYNAFIEGWALYSEQIAYEMGMYQDDPFGNLGRLQDELFRAVRLVVDTGLHHKRWSREKAINYMQEITGTPESSCRAEIERYMTWPGQALGYKLGMLKILELREQAKTQLGERFDLAEFHDLILTGGAVPMAVLESKVNRWIAQQM